MWCLFLKKKFSKKTIPLNCWKIRTTINIASLQILQPKPATNFIHAKKTKKVKEKRKKKKSFLESPTVFTDSARIMHAIACENIRRWVKYIRLRIWPEQEQSRDVVVLFTKKMLLCPHRLVRPNCSFVPPNQKNTTITIYNWRVTTSLGR